MLKLFKKTPQKMRILGGPFKGASVYLNPANSKRKIFGLYEYCINDWIKQTAPEKNFAFDVGANSGYDTYGLAHLLSNNNTKEANILSIEPEASSMPELLRPKSWKCYSNTKFKIIEKFADSHDSSKTVTLDTIFNNQTQLHPKSGIVKIDVEGAEVRVLKGSQSLLSNPRIDWLIEIHGKKMINPVSEFFNKIERPYLIKELNPIPFIGQETRSIDTYWLVTI